MYPKVISQLKRKETMRISNNVKKIFKGKLIVEEVKIERLSCMGRKDENKIRAITVTMTDIVDEWELVKSSHQLREQEELWLKKVGIAPDVTRKESEEEARLKELQENRRQGGWWIIRKGRIVKLDDDRRQ